MKVVLCDSNTINSYGFRTDVAGIDLTRFKKNPVMLYNHNPLQVIGRWEHITADGGKLTAEPVFDMEDAFAAEIARKVKDGFIKGCSMGLMITQITQTKGIDTATESVLLEASIVSIPADENALVVYADETRQKKLSINEFNKLFYTMEPQNTEEMTTLRAQVADKDAKIAELSAEIDSLKKDIAERDYHEADDYASKIVAEGKVPAELQADITAMYLENKERTIKVMDAIRMPEAVPHVSLSSMVKATGSSTLTWDDLDHTPGALKQLKADNPEEFKRLYREKFGCEPLA